MPSKPRRIKCDTLDITFASAKEGSQFFGVALSTIIYLLNADKETYFGLTFTWIDI